MSEQRHLRLLVEYHGGQFAGFQRQTRQRSVQGELERALAQVTQVETPVTGAGRTDTGVHAMGQVVHFTTGSTLSVESLKNALNGVLARDVAVRRSQEVTPQFHARYSATGRRYCYRLLNRPEPSPMLADRTAWISGPLDREAMAQLWHQLPGNRDCSAFAPQRSLPPLTTCRIQATRFIEQDDEIRFEIQADRFLHHMVRALVGTVLQVGRQRLSMKKFNEILDSQQRQFVGTLAPSHGLCLMEVLYPPEFRWEETSAHHLSWAMGVN